MPTFNASAPRRDLEITEADDVTISITYEDTDGNAQDISGWEFWITAKQDRSDSDTDAVFQTSVTNHTDAANGETDIDIAAADTDGHGGETLVYDLQRKDASGDVQTFMTGRLYVAAETTEAA